MLKDMKSISDNDIVYHKPVNKLDSLDFDTDKVMKTFPVCDICRYTKYSDKIIYFVSTYFVTCSLIF